MLIEEVWPVAIPLPLVDYTAQPLNTTLSSAPAFIASVRRSRFTMSYPVLAVTWMLKDAQLVALRTFYEVNLGTGAAIFQIPLRFPKNSELTNWAARFTAGFSAVHQDGLWQVQSGLQLVHQIVI